MDDRQIQAGISATLSEDAQLKAATLRNNFASVAGTSPDDFAKQKALSEASGISLPHLLANPDVARTQSALKDTDFSGLVMKSPKTAGFLENPIHAGISRDDTDNLSAMERTLHSLNYFGGSMIAGGHDLVGAGAKLLSAVLPTTSDQDLAVLYKNDPVGLQRMRDQSLATFLDRFARGQTARSEKTMAGVTPQAKALFGDLKYATTDASEAAYLSPVKVISDAVRSLPTTGALLLTALLTRGASLKAEQSAIAAGMTAAEARTAATEAAVQMASKFGAASEGTIGYAQNALQTQSENEKIPFKKLEASPEYQELIAKGFDPAAARIYLASKSGEIAGVGGGVSDAVANAFGGKVLGKILSEGGGVLARMAKGFINEGAVEGIQSPLETWFQNAATKQLMDPSKDLSEGLLESTIQGFMVGGLTGSAFAGALGHSQQNEQAAESAARIAELFAAAANSLTGKRSPATLDAFIEHLAPGATVLIDPVKLNEVLSQSGVDLGVLPTAAAQMAEGEIGGSGIEIPVSELVTGLTGTGAEKSIVNHLRMAPDMPTLAEAQDFDSKAAEFFQTEADRILEQESKNADFTAAAQAVHDDLFTQLTAVGRHGPQVNTSYAKLGAAFYTTLANKLGVTPLQVRDGWTDSDGGVHRGYALKIGGDPSDAPQLSQGFSHGQAMLNIGLDVGATDRAQKIDAAFAKQEIEKLGVQVLSGAEVVGEYELDGAQVQEKTYVPHLSRPLTEAETTQLAEALGQEAIGHYYNGTGNLWGPNAAAWGDFSPAFFKDQAGATLASAQENELAQVTPQQARETNVAVSLPTSSLFTEAVANTPGASVSAEGLSINLIRFQKPEQEGARSVRTGVFYLPVGSKAARYYKNKGTMASGNAYGGSQAHEGETLLRGPLFVKGATGGKAPEAAYDQLKGKGAYQKMRTAVAHATSGWGDTRSQTVENVGALLSRYGADAGLAFEIVRNSVGGNLLPYAVQENIVAHAVREAGYDAVVGYSKGKEGPFISEVFDVREQTYPARGMDSQVHDVFDQSFRTVSQSTIEAYRQDVAWTSEGTENGFPVWASQHVALAAPRDVTAGHDVFYMPLAGERAVKYDIRTPDGKTVGYTVLEIVDGWPVKLLDIETQKNERGNRYAEYTVAAIANDVGELAIWHIVPEARSWWGRQGATPVDEFNGTLTFAEYADARASRGNPQGVGDDVAFHQSAPVVRAGVVSAPVVGVHFSKQAREMLNSGYFGTGTKGAEAERLAQSNDPRIKQRIAFYIDEGSGVHPEPGVGGVAHVATLSNLYDADADTLKIFRRNQRDLNAAESAVLDAGFDGYLQRKNFTNQGTAVLLGSRGVDAEHVGGVEEANARATIPPPADIPAMKTLALQLMNDRTLPGGALLPSEWKAELMKKDSPLVRLIDFDQFNPDERIYKDQLAGALWQTSGTWYYSQLTRAIENASDKIFTTGKSAAQWLTANAGKLGVKKEELEFTGITDWLALQPKVTKADVVAFMQQGGVKVEEVILSDNAPAYQRDDGKWVVRGLEDQGFFESKHEAQGHFSHEELKDMGLAPKFEEYVLPGGENYRELLLTLPADTATLAEQARIRQLRAEGGRAYAAEPRGVFRSPHYDQPNILAHVRFNERTDAEGARVLFVEEVQSDWGQKGKKDGFGVERETKPVSEGEYSDFMTRMKDAAAEELVRRGAGQVTLDTARVIANSQPILAVAEWAGMTAEYADIQARQDEDYQIDQRGRGAVPSAPFVTDTKAWTGLAVKRILAYAAENGFDKVAWTTGEQQAERYDLSKTLQKVTAMTSDGGKTFRIQGTDLVGQGHDFGIHPVGTLEDVVGKELAATISEQKTPNGVYAGNDLKVGGEGMKGFYDGILPQVVRDVLKKVGGGQVETVTIATPDNRPMGGGAVMRLGDSKQTEQQGFAITPAMREAVSKGLPLFQPGQEAPKLGSFSPQTLALRLLANADYSTFVHELGHFFLTAYADIAAQEGAPQSIVDDMNAILKQFGVADLATWNAMPLEQQRPYHEQLAESFEQYVFTGKAPSLELQPLFSTMLSWFKKVYGSLKDFVAGHPGAKLNPELSAIFDRMLATDAEIAAANAARGYVALFKDAAEAGMSDKAFAAYTALDDAQREDAEAMLRTRSLRDMKWLQARRNKIIAALQEDAKEKRAEVRKEIAAEVKAEPIRQAERYLKHGVILNEVGADIAPLGPNKLQISEVKALFPEEALTPQPDFTKLNYGKYGLLAEVGLSPEEVATRFGIESGTDLVTELLNLPKINDDIEARTDQAMLERYGDLSSPDAIARAADEAIHNDFRTRAVATELSALAANIGPASVLMKAAKEYARQVLETKTSKTLKPWSYAAAETRAGKAAMAALKKGDREQAAVEKRTELVNHVTAKESYAVEKEIKAIVAKFKKLAAYNDKSSAVKSRDFATVQALRVILADHGVGVPKGVSANEYLETVKEHDPAAFARLSELVAVTGEEPKHWTEITVANLRNLAEAVDDIWFAAARTRQMEVQGKMVSQEAIAAELLETLVAQGIPDRVPGEGWAPTKAEKRKMKFGAMKAQWQRMEFIASKLDGNRAVGPWLKNIISVVQDGLNDMNVVKADVMSQYAALLDTIAPTLKNGEINAPELGYLFGKEGSGMIELLHAILHTGNESNMRKMLLGRGWAVERQDKSLDTSKWDTFITRMIAEGRITKAHYDFAQGVWNLMESLKDDAQKAHRAVFGKFFATVTARPFTNQFGTYAGGYVPALTDSDIVHDREVEKLRDAATNEMGVAFPEPPKGFTNKRVTNYNKELKLDLRSLGAHINQVLLFSHMAVPVADIRRVLSRPEISGALNRLYPGMIVNAINPWLVRVARNTVSPLATDMTRFIRMARSRAGTNTMMGSISNSVQQITGIIPATVAIDSKYLRRALVDVISHPVDTTEMVKELSVYMRTRIDNEVNAAMDNVEQILVNPNVYQSVVDWTRRHAYFMQSAVDNALSPTMWLAAYNQAKDKNPTMSDGDAVHIADAMIRKTQGASGSADIATFEAGHPFVQLFTQFTGYFNMMAQFLQGEWVKNLARDVGLPKKYARAFYIVGIGFYAQAVAAELISMLFRGGPDDEDKDGAIIDDWLFQLGVMAPVKFATATVPFLGSALMVALNKWNSKPYDDKMMNSPAVSAIEGALGAPVDVYKALFEDGKPSKAIRSVAGIGGLFGLPTALAARPIGYVADAATGHINPTNELDAIRGILTGTASPDSKR